MAKLYKNMKDIKFNNGELSVVDKKLAIFLAFSKLNSENEKYNLIEKCLPKIKGLKSAKKRAEFAFDLVNEMIENSIWITKISID